ncbi:3-hydroxyacyl-CoA dehydrogenase NAD-binding domain-containing protein [Roseomonas sp. NAR14]|uniref:3-hydroxyacyl-CoA dehydrogenase NAD-binding domain-containing protein n=1 Tax=Roseomonas acroporae TaxID=2937791 RepID=A0A9X1Y980_9PROT|nr:3-hydroxyacyl-CoA dehydrogenase NAD-binding domain-containing protein [Roseomonas acroporae]MCK8784640.1 3-hydroxyacyl-CoA dehydrogenase NAD-binding domain-containing protein [Roseomonas acroporae]
MTAANPVTTAREDGILVARIANPPVNALSAAVRAGLLAAAREAAADASVKALVLAAEGRTFIAGADITEFGKPPVPPSLPEVIDALEALDKPVVAAINGAALGGGLEVALGCHARIAAPGAKLGLPEVKLGILPGAGGTQRLPRLIGAAAAARLASEGEPVDAAKAAQLGIVDAVAEGDLLAAAKAKALALVGTAPRRASALTDKLTPATREEFEQAAAAIAKKAGDNPSVAAILDCVRLTFDTPFAQGMAAEREAFKRLVADDRSKAMRHLFFAERESSRIPGQPKGTTARPVAKAAVIGAGTMGGGIAMCFANAGIPVTVIETSEEGLQRGLERVGQTYDISVKRGSLKPEERERRMGRITGKVGLEAAADADIVIEAAFEEMGVKKDIFGTLDRVAKPGAVLATNTSYLNVDEIAAATSRPGDVLGMHFFSPANVMKLLEVVRAEKTSPDALATAVEIGRKLAKVPVTVGVCFGFVGNRMLSKRTAEVERLLLEGASPSDIDAALAAFGFRMGACAMGDLAGLDIGWRIRKATGKKAPVADALCEAGRLGQKTGAGYYRYEKGDRTPHPDPAVTAIIEKLAAERGITRRAIPQQELIERLVFPMINEGARILEEGVAYRPGDIDVIWLYGYNWPAQNGGPMFYAGLAGLPHIVERLDRFAEQTGDESLRPAALLRRLAAEGRSFADLKESDVAALSAGAAPAKAPAAGA